MKAILTLCSLLFLAQTALADGAPAARRFLQERHSAVMKILQDASSSDAPERDARLKAAIGELLDYSELSRRALAEHWDGLDEGKRKRFVELLSQLVERSYQKNLESTINFEVRYGEATRKGDSILITTEARSLKNRRAPAVEIDYTLLPAGSGYRVYDVTTDGVSLVTNYKRQFNKIIRRDGIDGLLAKMKKRLDEGSDTF